MVAIGIVGAAVVIGIGAAVAIGAEGGLGDKKDIKC